MQRPDAAARKHASWPTPTPEQVEVVLLGTYHMDDPGLDAANVDVDDVLADGRQRELESLASHLEAAEPDHVAVERPAERADALNDVYRRYRDGEVGYDEEYAFEPRHAKRDDEAMACRSEVVQVGFRLADRLGHDAVVPVDAEETLDGADVGAALGGEDAARKVDVPEPDVEALEERLGERLASSTIPAYHRYLNEERNLHANDGMFQTFVRATDDYAGADTLAGWYQRNLRMVQNLYDVVESGDERVLFLVGSGHVHVLRHLLSETPQFCPLSALPYLPRGD